MKSKSVLFIHGLAALFVAGGLLIASVPVFSQPGTDGNAATQQERLRKHISNRLDKMAARLQITPAQQDAWSQYRSTVEALVGSMPTPPAADADAEIVMRWRATRAAEHARRLALVADATGKLQSVLDAEQRKTLANMVRHDSRLARRSDFPGNDRAERHFDKKFY